MLLPALHVEGPRPVDGVRRPGGESGVRHAPGHGFRADGRCAPARHAQRNDHSADAHPRTIINALPRPGWWINFLTTEPLAFASIDRWSGTVVKLLDTMFDLIGWDRGFDLLRVAMRYSASFLRNFEPYDRALYLVKQYGLEAGVAARDYQPEHADRRRAAFISAPPHARPELAAQSLAEGLSPNTILAAVCLVACDFYLMTDPVPHEDFDAISREVAPMHLNTSTSALRTMLPRLSPRMAALADHAPAALLTLMHDALHAHDTRTATAAARAYTRSGAPSEDLIGALTAVACTDDGTLMHSIKHMGALTREFALFAHEDRGNYLIAASRFMAWFAGKDVGVYQRAVKALDLVA